MTTIVMCYSKYTSGSLWCACRWPTLHLPKCLLLQLNH